MNAIDPSAQMQANERAAFVYDANGDASDPTMRARLDVWVNEGGAPEATSKNGDGNESVSECSLVEHAL